MKLINKLEAEATTKTNETGPASVPVSGTSNLKAEITARRSAAGQVLIVCRPNVSAGQDHWVVVSHRNAFSRVIAGYYAFARIKNFGRNPLQSVPRRSLSLLSNHQGPIPKGQRSQKQGPTRLNKPTQASEKTREQALLTSLPFFRASIFAVRTMQPQIVKAPQGLKRGNESLRKVSQGYASLQKKIARKPCLQAFDFHFLSQAPCDSVTSVLTPERNIAKLTYRGAAISAADTANGSTLPILPGVLEMPLQQRTTDEPKTFL